MTYMYTNTQTHIQQCVVYYLHVNFENHHSSFLQWRYYSGFVIFIHFLKFTHTLMVVVLAFSDFTNSFHVCFLIFQRTLCLIVFLCWNDLNLFLFVGFLQCFLYSVLTSFFFPFTFLIPWHW